ncbi:bifunctional Delta(1)-pyrroline-2-carboxylate/Delta(1)-piperideine-2-carboxylate reductase [Pseudoalteromonas sp. GB56]
MKIVSAEHVQQVMAYPPLLKALQKGFAGEAGTPRRSVYPLDTMPNNHDAFAVLPAWNDDVIGVKAFTYFPENEQQGRASLYSKIMLFSRQYGEPLALVDGTEVTLWRTSAVSALAADYLAKKDAQHLVLFGSGKLAPFMARAHLAVRDYKKVSIVARSSEKAQWVIESLREQFPACEFSHEAVNEALIASADTICCATGSHTPLFEGHWLSTGTHVDLIGNHHRDARECDSQTVTRAKVFVDSRENVLNEAGELLIPMSEGVFSESDVLGELKDLARDNTFARANDTDITLFKSVGTALSDLIAAKLAYDEISHVA